MSKNKTQPWEEERDKAIDLINSPTFYGLTLDFYQKEFVAAAMDDEKMLIISDARAGCGKTVLAAGCAEALVKSGKYDGIIYITAPVQEENLGFLPGTIQEKTDIYGEPFVLALEKVGVNPYIAIERDEEDIKYSTAYIQLRPHNYLRGLTFEKKVVIVDECQNFRFSELKKIITRCCDNCKVFLLGHTMQCDLRSEQVSGFYPYLEAAKTEDFAAICPLVTNYRGQLSTWADSVRKN